MESFELKLPEDMLERLNAVARDEDLSVGQVIRTAIDRDFRRRDDLFRPNRVCETLLAPLRARVTEDFIHAKDWRDLKARLLGQGFILRESGGGMAIHDAITGRFEARTSEIGFGYPALLRRFGSHFPGHSHAPLLDEIRKIRPHARPGI